MCETGIGASILRKEDKRFLTGKGNYVADIKRPDMTDRRVPALAARACAILRVSRYQRRPRRCRASSAIFTGADLAADNVGGIPCGWGITNVDGTPMKEPAHPALAIGKVRCVGDAVAFVVADTIEEAREAAEAIEVEYEMLPAVVGVLDAIRPGAAAVFDEIPDNTCFDWECGDAKATAAAFANAAHVARISLVNNRLVGNPMEPRAAVAEYDAGPRALHAVDHEPVPAHREAADGQLRAQHPAAQAARRGAGRRRRLRRQAVPLRRGDRSRTWASRKVGVR